MPRLFQLIQLMLQFDPDLRFMIARRILHFVRAVQRNRLSDSMPDSMFAVVTVGKQLIRGSERIGVFSAIIKQTNRSSLSRFYIDTVGNV